jgi:hypothetical protein
MSNLNDSLFTLERLAETSRIAGNGDLLDMLGALRTVELAVSAARRAVVAEAREAGTTWEEIGDALGITRQAAQQRFGQAD